MPEKNSKSIDGCIEVFHRVGVRETQETFGAFPKINAGGKGHTGGFEDFFGQGERIIGNVASIGEHVEGTNRVRVDFQADRLKARNQLAPSLIILDLMMPVMDGFEFIMQARKDPDWRKIPIVVVTAKDLSDADRERLQGSVVGLIEKRGFGQAELLEQIRELVSETTSAAEGIDGFGI